MIVPAIALAAGLAGPWLVARSTGRGSTPRLAVAAQITCLLLAWSGALALVADAAAPSVGLVRACAIVVTAVLRGDADPLAWGAAGVYVVVAGRTAWCLGSESVRSRRMVAAIRSGATHDGRTWRVSCGPSVGFTAGLVRPLIVVADDRWSALDAATREVVVAHEVAHARGRHALVHVLARGLGAGLQPWPGARLAVAEVRRNLEAAADDSAARLFGSTHVARAIGQVALAPATTSWPGTMGASGWAVWRVRRLLHPHKMPRWRRVPASAATASSLAFGAQGAAHAVLGAHLVPLAVLCHV